MRAIERNIERPLIALEMPAAQQLNAASDADLTGELVDAEWNDDEYVR